MHLSFNKNTITSNYQVVRKEKLQILNNLGSIPIKKVIFQDINGHKNPKLYLEIRSELR